MTSPLRELIARYTTEADTKPLEKSDGLLDSLAKKSGVVGEAFKQLRTYIGGAAIVGGVIHFARDFVAEAENLQYTSDRIRTTTRDLQVMGAVGRSVGLDLNATTGILSTLRGKLDESVRGLGDGGYTFRRLGVQFRDGERRARPLVDVFGDVIQGLAGIRSETRRNLITDRLLGAEGRRLVREFGGSRDAVREFTDALNDAGGGTSQEAIDSGIRLSRAWSLAGLSVDGFRSRVAVFLLPKLEALVRVGGRMIAFLNRTTIVTNGLRIAIGALGVYGVRSLVSMNAASALLLAKFALVAAAIGVVVLVVDDLITLFSGGKSVIGGFIDELFGVGTAAAIVTDLRERFGELTYFVRESLRWVREFWDSVAPQWARDAFESSPRTTSGAAPPPTRINRPSRPLTPQEQALSDAIRNGPRPAALPAPRATPPGLPAPGSAAARLQGLAGAATGLVPLPGLRGAPGAPSVSTDARITVQVTAPSSDPAAVGRASGQGTQRALERVAESQARALDNAGLVRNRSGVDRS